VWRRLIDGVIWHASCFLRRGANAGECAVTTDVEKVARARRRIRIDPAQADVLRLREVICEPARLRIVEALGDEELSVGDLAAAIDRKVPATSQHLKVLRDLGIVEGSRRATTVYYRLRHDGATRRVTDVVRSLERAGVGRLASGCAS
jgi:DNA-binding transcriptional ArsR family regulator